MFVGKARNLPWSGALERCFTQVGSSLTCKHKIRLEKFTRDKHSSLLEKFVNYSPKKLYNIDTRGQYYTNFFSSITFRMLVISKNVCLWQMFLNKSNVCG
jgi:hypothetical protein